MSILSIAWSMCAGVSVTLGLMHLFLWFRERPSAVHMLSSVMAFSAGVSAILEYALLSTRSLADYKTLIRWENLAVALILVPMVWFVHAYFGTGRRWLAATISALWCAGILLNFLFPGSLTFAEIDELVVHTAFWGEDFALPIGQSNPWAWLANLASVLILVYVADASIRAWRKGMRRRSAVVGGAIVFFICTAGAHTPLVDAGLVATPYMISFAFLAILLAMSYELVDDVVLASRLTRAIQVSERRWRTLLENVQLAVVGVDPSGAINYVNPYLQRLMGRQARDLCGKPVTDLVPAEDRTELGRRFRLAADGGPRPQSRWTLQNPDGDRYHVDWSTVRLEDRDGGFAGLLSIGADVTDRLRAEQQLRHTQGELERLGRANLLGELASALAHELNQPLAAILANAQAARRYMAQDNPDLGEIREILDDIVRDDKRAGGVIHGLRAMLERGEVRRERFGINAAVRDTLPLVDSELRAQGVRVQTRLTPGLPQIRAGRIEIQQVLINLFLNAARAMADTPPERREIRVCSALVEGQVRVDVEDNGPGVPDADLPRIFEAHFAGRPGGLGMGLAISRRILEHCGGRIRARNLAGGGAHFWFLLPPAIDRGEGT